VKLKSNRAVLSVVGIAGVLFLAGGGCSSADGPESSSSTGRVQQAVTGFPQYDHVFLIINENHNFNQIIKNPAAPIINALANAYGLATSYTGVSDPSEPNYVAMLGGSPFTVNDDQPYVLPGFTISADNLMSQLETAHKTWKGYFQDMPYAGYRGYCFPAKCNGIPDADTEYVAKHNGIVNFANMQTPTEWVKQAPYSDLATDLANSTVPNLSYIVADECHDMHGAPPWCVDSGKSGDVNDTWLVAQGDAFVGQTVNAITSSSTWASGNNAIVVTFDEGNVKSDKVVTIVATNHGPRGITDNTSYDHYSLLASLQATFGGLPCLLNSCSANLMTPLFQITGSSGTPTLPPPFVPAPNGTDTITPGGAPVKGKTVSLNGTGWFVVPSPTIGNYDNNLTAVSAASATDAWAVGAYYAPSNTNILVSMAEHFDGKSWTEFPLSNIGPNQNTLLAVSELPSGHAWAAGFYINAEYAQQTLIQHYDGKSWSIVPSPSPGARQNILYGIAAISDTDVWAVGGYQDASSVWHTLAEHYDGSAWSVSKTTLDAGAAGNQFYAVTAVSTNSVYATGNQSGSGFPTQVLTEHYDGHTWSVLGTPSDTTATPVALGITGTDTLLNVVGDVENSVNPYTTLVATGAPGSLSILTNAPNSGAGENDLFGAATASDGSTWAAGWAVTPSSLTHFPLTLQGVNGQWSVVASPDPGTGDTGLAGITAIPGGGLWAVGVTSNNGNFSTLIMYHP
jgi:hypothetical protein